MSILKEDFATQVGYSPDNESKFQLGWGKQHLFLDPLMFKEIQLPKIHI